MTTLSHQDAAITSNECEVCHSKGPLFRCTGCQSASYCGTSCQTVAWGAHKKTCSLISWQKKRDERIAQYRKETKEIVGKMTEEEFKWKAWVAEHGRGVHVNDKNLKDYVPDTEVYVAGPESKSFPDKLSVSQSLLPLEPARIIPQPPVSDDAHWDKEPILPGHGAKYPLYEWRQTTLDIEIRFILPMGTGAKDVVVNLTPTHLYLSCKGVVVIDEDFGGSIYVGSNSDDRGSYWMITNKCLLVIHATKWLRRNVGCVDASQTFWRLLFPFETAFSGYPPSAYYETKDTLIS